MKKEQLINIGLFLLYCVITLFSVLHHEIWADEAQVWQLCRNLNISELINHLHNEGHPSFFYLLVMPFAKLSSNIIHMQLICWLAMCVSVYILLFKSPFNFLVKLAIISSAGFIYFLPVMARNYAIIPVLVFLAAYLYSKKKENPILYGAVLFLLANTHAIMTGFVGILLCVFAFEIIKEKKLRTTKNFSAIFIIILGLLCVFLQLHNTTSSNEFITYKEKTPYLFTAFKVILFFFLNAYNKMITINKTLPFAIIDIPLILTMISSFVLMLVNLYHNNKKAFLIFFTGIGFQFAVYIFIYSNNQYVTRIFAGLIILIFCFWLLYKENTFDETNKLFSKKGTTILISLFFFLTTFNGINFIIKDYKYEYTGGKQTANYIKENFKKDSILLIDNEPYMIALAYYLKDDFKLFSTMRGKNLDYVVWDKINANRLTSFLWKEYCTQLQNLKKDKDIYVLISTSEENRKKEANKLQTDYPNNFQLVYSSPYIIEINEGHKIYKFIK